MDLPPRTPAGNRAAAATTSTPRVRSLRTCGKQIERGTRPTSTVRVRPAGRNWCNWSLVRIFTKHPDRAIVAKLLEMADRLERGARDHDSPTATRTCRAGSRPLRRSLGRRGCGGGSGEVVADGLKSRPTLTTRAVVTIRYPEDPQAACMCSRRPLALIPVSHDDSAVKAADSPLATHD